MILTWALKENSPILLLKLAFGQKIWKQEEGEKEWSYGNAYLSVENFKIANTLLISSFIHREEKK